MLKPNQLMLIKEAGYGHLFTQNTKLIWITRWNDSHLLNWKISFFPPCFNLGGGGCTPDARVTCWVTGAQQTRGIYLCVYVCVKVCLWFSWTYLYVILEIFFYRTGAATHNKTNIFSHWGMFCIISVPSCVACVGLCQCWVQIKQWW